MRTRTLSILFFASTSIAAALAAACSGSDAADPLGPKDQADSGHPDTSLPPTGDSAPPVTPDTGPPPSNTVTFKYVPSWIGVKTVTVLGAFGTAMDWKQPFVTLADDGKGTFTGTATLPAGQYLYVFKVTGDSAAAQPAMYARYAIDPGNPAYADCPADSPTFDKNAPNPCSQLTVPQAAAAPTYHVKGLVTSAGAAIAGYLVVLEREEPKSHHFYVDRMTTGTDGTFDLLAATGTYRLQVQHPTFIAENDTQRTPDTLAAMRRSISSSFLLGTDTTINAAEIAYDGYAAMAPRDAGTLPTTFTFSVVPGAKTARLAVYGPGNNIGDPWYSGAATKATSAEFDGGFNTKQASDGGLVPDATYWWGTEQQFAQPEGGVAWTGQSMVFPIRWP